MEQNAITEYEIQENMMGPSALILLEELLANTQLRSGMRVLDLGCGKGLSSMYLATKFHVEVFAVDLWISATENWRRFVQHGLDNQIIPIHADAKELPFADQYFDAVVSVDAYHYFGNHDHYFAHTLLPLLKPQALVAIAFPGMKHEVFGAIPSEMEPFWNEEALDTWHGIEWWKPKFQAILHDFHIWEMRCFDTAWQAWLSTENPHAIADREMIRTDRGRYMNLIGITGIGP